MMAKKDRKDESMDKTHKKGSGKLILATTFLSGITGALIAYMTPKTGEIVREKILNLVSSLKESEHTADFKSGFMARSGNILNTLNQGATKFLEHSFSLLEDSKELITAAYLAGKEAYERGNEEVPLIEGLKEDSGRSEQEDLSEQQPVPVQEERETEQEPETQAQEQVKDSLPEKEKIDF